MASDCARVYERVEAAKESGFLNLSECKLTQIPNGVFMVMKSTREPEVDPPITRLSLAKNALKNFPSKIIRETTLFGRLTSLDISGNKIGQLPAELTSLDQLTEVNLAGNKFEYLPEIVWSLPAGLKRLNLADNSIADVDVERIAGGGVEGLEYLDLGGNPLAERVKVGLTALAAERGFRFVCD